MSTDISKRLQIINKPKGRAMEYAESSKGAKDGYSLNIYKGCQHNCAYCYVPLQLPWRTLDEPRRSFHSKVMPRVNFLNKLEHDCKLLEGTEVPVHLCFTCDAYPSRNNMMTRRALEMMAEYNFKNVQLLTKGGFRGARDFDLLKSNDWSFGTSLVFYGDKGTEKYEPGAAPYLNRTGAIELACSKGIETWVSLEPIIDLEQTLEIIQDLRPFVHHWKVGKLNHGKECSPDLARIEETTDWAWVLERVRSQLDGLDYVVKEDLLAYEA